MIRVHFNVSGEVQTPPICLPDGYSKIVAQHTVGHRWRFEFPESTPPCGWGAWAEWGNRGEHSARFVVPLARSPRDNRDFEAGLLTPEALPDFAYTAAHVDPSHVPLHELARLKGAMWTVPGPWRFGPRPGQPTNLTATGFLHTYEPDERAALLAHYKAHGYTHCVYGPPIGGDGYHGLWPFREFTTPDDFEVWLDMVQEIWDAGLMPIIFLGRDNWSLEQIRDFYTPLIAHNPRAQRLIRIVVPAGWEPTQYGWSSHTWAEFGKWGRQLLPNALQLLHTAADVHAATGADARGNDTGQPGGHATSWARVVPYFHGWLWQSRSFERELRGERDHAGTAFENWQREFNPQVAGSLAHRFHTGYAGWPRGSAWGSDQPLKVYAGEYCSYWVTWHGATYQQGQAWGDAAIRNGAPGVLDSCALDVP